MLYYIILYYSMSCLILSYGVLAHIISEPILNYLIRSYIISHMLFPRPMAQARAFGALVWASQRVFPRNNAGAFSAVSYLILSLSSPLSVILSYLIVPTVASWSTSPGLFCKRPRDVDARWASTSRGLFGK